MPHLNGHAKGSIQWACCGPNCYNSMGPLMALQAQLKGLLQAQLNESAVGPSTSTQWACNIIGSTQWPVVGLTASPHWVCCGPKCLNSLGLLWGQLPQPNGLLWAQVPQLNGPDVGPTASTQWVCCGPNWLNSMGMLWVQLLQLNGPAVGPIASTQWANDEV